MLVAAGDVRNLGGPAPRLVFGEQQTTSTAGPGRRVLVLDDVPAFELSWWCGTCPFLFRRLWGAAGTLSIQDLGRRLADGIADLDEQVIDRFADLLPRGPYLPLLLDLGPRLVHPVHEGDYFAEDQVATWGVNSFWGLPEHPRTPYYRTFDTPVDDEAHLHEFVVPMVPPTWNDRAAVDRYAASLTSSSAPTAVAVATLDVCTPAMDDASTDYYTHWDLTHFLLDGHHKMQASAETGRRVRLLSLLSLDGGLASPDQVAAVPLLRSGPMAGRRR